MYIPQDADESLAGEFLESNVSLYENAYPESVKIILGDFKHNVPTYEQYVQCTTRGDATLDKMYCNVKDGYRVLKRPCLGNFDHNILFCLPTYKQVLKREQCKEVEIRK